MFKWLRRFAATWQVGTHPRDPAVASWVSTPTASGEDVTETTALNLSAVWCAAQIYAGAFQSMPCLLIERSGESRRRAVDAPLWSLLHDEPNPDTASGTFFATAITHRLLWGNAFAEIERDGMGDPVGLWLLTPDRVRIERDEGGVRYLVRQAKGGVVELDAASVLHFPGLSFDGVRGYSVVSRARESLGLAMATDRFGAAFFGNGAVPGGVIKHPGRPSEPAIRRLRESWNNRHQGAGRAHGVAVLDEGMTYEKIGIPPEDAQFLETRKFSVSEIARWFNVPPHMLKDLDRATFSNIEHQGIEWLTGSILPAVKCFEQEMTRKLLRREARARNYIAFETAGLLRTDIKTRYDAYQIGVYNGWFNIDEVRAREDLNPLPDGMGQTFVRPTNVAPIAPSQTIPLPVVPPEPDDEDEPTPDDETESPPREQALAGFRLTLADAVERGRRIVTNAVARANKAGKLTDGWLADFAAKHADVVRDMLAPILDGASLACGVEPGPAALAAVNAGVEMASSHGFDWTQTSDEEAARILAVLAGGLR